MSWDILERKSLLDRLACSAACRAARWASSVLRAFSRINRASTTASAKKIPDICTISFCTSSIVPPLTFSSGINKIIAQRSATGAQDTK